MDCKPSTEALSPMTQGDNKTPPPLTLAEKINYTLYDISNAVNTTHSLEDVYPLIYGALNKLIPLPNFFIAVYDAKTETLQFKYFIDEQDANPFVIERSKFPHCLTGEVILARRPLFLKENMLLDRAKKEKLLGTLPKIWMGVPLIIQDKVCGIIGAHSYTDPDYFSHTHLEILICVSDQISLAMERKHLLDALKKNEKLLSRITGNTRSMVGIMDTHGIHEFASPSYARLGYGPKDLLETSFFQQIHPDDVEPFMLFLKKGIAGSVSHLCMDFRMKAKDGHFYPLEGRFDLIRNDDGFMEKLLFVGEDISETPLAEKPFQGCEEQLIQRSRIDSMGTLANGFVHDYNNLLSGIMGYLELLSLDQENLSDSQKDNVATALMSSRKAAALTRQMQILAGPKTVSPSVIDVYKVIADVFDSMEQSTSPLIAKKNDLVENQFFVKGYEDALFQAFMNLGINAVQAIEKKGLSPDSSIRVFAARKEEGISRNASLIGTDHLHLCFQDTGCGMTRKMRDEVADPMFSSKKKGEGKGIGLTLAYYTIVKKHDGAIDIETSEGRGTTFHIYLPVAAPPGKSHLPPKRSKTILVIEDEDMAREIAVKALKSFGYRTLQARDGEIGLDMYKKNHHLIDAVLLDIIIPKLSGAQIFKQMLEIDPHVKVIVASGHVTRQDQKVLFAKAAAYLDKPYQMAELKQAFQSALD